MTEKKISGLDELLISAADDELIINDTSEAGSGAEITKRIKLSNLIAGMEKLNFAEATELTISSGSITATQSCHKIQPESETADDLETISGLNAGDFLVLYVSDAGTDTITIKHGTGNISCLTSSDVELSEGAALFYYDGTTVYMIGGGGGGGGVDALADLSDVDVTDVTNRDILIYNSTTAKWESGAATVESISTTSGNVSIDFLKDYLTHAITGDVTYSSSNLAAGRCVTIKITCDSTKRTLTFPSGWKFLTTKPADIEASTMAVLSLTSFGTADSDVIAAYVVEYEE